jgi:hypothetical protein
MRIAAVALVTLLAAIAVGAGGVAGPVMAAEVVEAGAGTPGACVAIPPHLPVVAAVPADSGSDGPPL